jgi:hypothetical protein
VDGAGRHAEGLGDPVDVGQPPAGWQSDDDGAYLAQCRVHVRGAAVARGRGEAHGEQGVGESAGGLDGRAQRGGAVAVQQVGGVESVGQGEAAGIVAAGGELPEDAFGGLLSGGVVVGGDQEAGPLGAQVGPEKVGLPVGEGGAEGGDADGVTVGGEGERDGVQRPFDERGSGAVGEGLSAS